MTDMNLQAMQNRASAQTDQVLAQAMSVRMFVYSIKFSAVAAAAGTFSGNLQITADADFLIQYQNSLVWDPTAHSEITNPGAVVQIQDSGSSTNFFNQAVPIQSVFGDGYRPFLLPMPRLVSKNSTLSISGTNATTTNAVDIYLSFIGMKVYQ
jgi:hypothetical protein